MNTTPLITQLLEYVRLAPSVHNTQPWRFRADDNTVSLIPASERFLDSGDPTQRELWISLGACLETILQAASGLGLKAEIVSTQTESLDLPVATVKITPGESDNQAILASIKNRHSYRRKLLPLEMPEAFSEECQRSLEGIEGVTALVMTERSAIEQVAAFTDKAMQLALSSPEFREELAELINPNWSQSRTGMHGFVLNKGLIGSAWEKFSMKHGLGLKSKAHADKQKVLDSSALLFVATTGDVPRFWLNAGRAYMRLALLLTQRGYAHSTIAAPVEAASFHEDVEKMLETKGRIQTMMRIGNPSTQQSRSSSRLRADELLT